MRKYVQLCCVSSTTFLQLFILLCSFGHSKKNPILGFDYKVVLSRYKDYVIRIS